MCPSCLCDNLYNSFYYCSSEVCEVLETEDASSEAQVSGTVQYQCLDCLALFNSPETWLEHRRTHNRSSTHSNTETTVRDATHSHLSERLISSQLNSVTFIRYFGNKSSCYRHSY